ncbi:MAG TPA: EVE domain-containing protein [Polyangiaceae bacterium]|jgi:predicted RNA-binding protein with PUA-like domain
MPVAYFLVKSEPAKYSWSDLVRDGQTRWDGVRNFAARNHLRAMRQGDLVLFYHSGEGKQIVGIARVAKEAYPDPTAKEGDWSAVDLAPLKELTAPVGLSQMRSDQKLGDLLLLRQGRLSVMSVAPAHFQRILTLGKTKL